MGGSQAHRSAISLTGPPSQRSAARSRPGAARVIIIREPALTLRLSCGGNPQARMP